MTSTTKGSRPAKIAHAQTSLLSGGSALHFSRCAPAVGIIVLTFVAFLPVLQNDFVNWDDLANITDNTHYRGLGWRNLAWMFTTYHESLYRPVTWLTFGLDYLLWGMEPNGYHLTSLLIHCANAVVFYFVALRVLRLALSDKSCSEQGLRAGAICAALFFSLHPLRVEPVAWASARNDVVAALFFLLAVLSYLRATSSAELPRSAYLRALAAAISFYACSLLAKASGIPLPFALIVLDIYPLRRLRGAPWRWLAREPRKILLEKLPFLILAVAAAVIALVAKQEFQAVHSLTAYGWWVRVGESFYGLAFYLWKTLLPINLSPLYQLPPGSKIQTWPFFLSAGVVGIFVAAVLRWRKNWPAGAAASACYAVLLIPFLGLVQFGPQIAADRYSYLACLSIALLPGAGTILLWHARSQQRVSRENFRIVVTLGVGVLAVFGLLSWRQSRVWHDSQSLWRYVLALEPASTYAYNNLAAEVKRRGNTELAIQYYRKVVELDPRFALAHQNLGDIFFERGALDEAVSWYRKTLEIDPNALMSHHKLGSLAVQRGRNHEAVQHYRRAIEVNPKFARAHNDLGNVLVALGDVDKAAEHFHKSAALDATATEPLFNLGNLMMRLNQPDRAMTYFRRAVEINPEFAQAHNNLGRLLAARGDLDRAVKHFREATRLQPSFAAAHESLIQALLEQGKKAEAWQHYQKAQKLLSTSRPEAPVR